MPSASLLSSKPTNKSTVSTALLSSTASLTSFSFVFPRLTNPWANPLIIKSDSLKTSKALGNLVGLIKELPAPWYLGVLAKSPIIPILRLSLIGSKLPSFFNNTKDFFAMLTAA